MDNISSLQLSALNEIGHGLSELREQGWRPRRTIVLASWGAEVKPNSNYMQFHIPGDSS